MYFSSCMSNRSIAKFWVAGWYGQYSQIPLKIPGSASDPDHHQNLFSCCPSVIHPTLPKTNHQNLSPCFEYSTHAKVRTYIFLGGANYSVVFANVVTAISEFSALYILTTVYSMSNSVWRPGATANPLSVTITWSPGSCIAICAHANRKTAIIVNVKLPI